MNFAVPPFGVLLETATFSRRFLVFIFILLLSANFAFATDEAGFVSDFQIRINNSRFGDISIIRNGVVEIIGQVVSPSVKLNEKGFTASTWAGTSDVTATAVNAIHIKVLNDKTIFSILPSDFLDPTKSNSYFNAGSSIYTNIAAGTKIFGGGYAPFVGNKALVNGNPITGALKEGDILTIDVAHPAKWPKSIIFENKFAGKITINYPDGSHEIIGEVLRPVQGVGRFEGSRFLSAGRIRANHPGVIDISTSVGGQVGGFQIIPATHAQSPEMVYARTKTQWMVVSGPSVESKTQEGLPPLFEYYLKPQYNGSDLESADWQTKLVNRFLVDVQLRGKTGWQPMPVYGLIPEEDLPESANRFLDNVEQIRILFPEIP